LATLYRLSGVIIASAIALPALPATAPEGERSLTFSTSKTPPGGPLADDAWELRGHGIAVGKGREHFVLRLPGCADYWIDRSGASVIAVPVDDCPEGTLAQLFLDQVLPLALHLRGRFAFHASSVALGRHALVAFLGQAGAGKSTLASSLARGADDALFSDDCLALEALDTGLLAHPSYASARLWPASAEAVFADRGALPLASPRTEKLRAALPVAAGPLPLQRLYLLESADGDPALTRLRPRDALVAIAAHLYRLDPEDRDHLGAELPFLEQVVTRVPVARLAYRRSYAALPAVRAAILADLADLDGPPPPALTPGG
jgi:hypothetical protein